MTSFKFELKGFDEAIKRLENKTRDLEKKVEKEVHYWGFDVMTEAKKLAPADEGYLRNRIDLIKTKMTAEVVVNAVYGAYMEFGTGKYAADYVSSLPSDWQTYASNFKGSSGGSFDDLIQALYEWIKRKGIRAKVKIEVQEDKYQYGKLQKDKKPKKVSKEDEQQQLAYVFAKSIMINGVKPHPFLYPAFYKNKNKLVEKIKGIINEGL